MKKILCLAVIPPLFWLLAGCATAVKPSVVKLCEQNKCDPIKEESPRQELLVKLYSLIKKNLNKSFPLYEVEPGKILAAKDRQAYPEQGFSFYVQGGPMPGTGTAKSITFNDILYVDRENMEIKLKVSYVGTWNMMPLLVLPAEAILSIKSATEVSLESDHLSSWMVVGTGVWHFKWFFDYIDFDRMILAGSCSTRYVGPLSLGGGKGYVQVSLGDALPDMTETPAVAQGAPPEKKPDSPAVASPPLLVFKTAVEDGSKDGIFDGGEQVTMRVDVENRGAGSAGNVEVQLTGDESLLRYFGNRRSIGDIQPGEKRMAEFKAVLPMEIEPGAKEIHVRVREGKGYSPEEMNVLKVAVRSGTVRESVEVISAVPKLVFNTQLRDQNGNSILDGGEEISLRIEVENKGEAKAEKVEVLLTGHPVLTRAFGNSRAIGDILVGEKKAALFKATLPAQIPSEPANLRVEIREGRGFAPPERKVLQVAMRAVEVREVVEVLSDIDVDDIPPRVKGYQRQEDFALIVGIGRYREKMIPEIKYAVRDAEVVAKYFEHLAGISPGNIKVLTDDKATKSDIESHLEDWLQKRATKNSTVFVYYAGHGAPDHLGKEAYIVPFEGHPDFPSKLYPLTRMYEALGRLPAKEVVVMLDSCFSGAKGRSVTSEGARPLVMSPGTPALAVGRITVIAGSTGSQISSDYDKMRHGLFTYYLLRGMRGEADRDKKGVVEIGGLFDYVKANVAERAVVEFNREQTPVLLPADAKGDKLRIPVTKTH